MHTDQVIVHTNRWPGGIYIRPDNPNTLAFQSVATNDAPRALFTDPLHQVDYIIKLIHRLL